MNGRAGIGQGRVPDRRRMAGGSGNLGELNRSFRQGPKDALVLQRLHNLPRHVVFVVLRQDLNCLERLTVKPASRNRTASFSEKIGKDSVEPDHDRNASVGDAKLNTAVRCP